MGFRTDVRFRDHAHRRIGYGCSSSNVSFSNRLPRSLRWISFSTTHRAEELMRPPRLLFGLRNAIDRFLFEGRGWIRPRNRPRGPFSFPLCRRLLFPAKGMVRIPNLNGIACLVIGGNPPFHDQVPWIRDAKTQQTRVSHVDIHGRRIRRSHRARFLPIFFRIHLDLVGMNGMVRDVVP